MRRICYRYESAASEMNPSMATTWLRRSPSGRERVGALPRKAAKSVGDPPELRRVSASPDEAEVFVDETPEPSGTLAPDLEEDAAAPVPEKPSMRDVFGPGGFLERCMIGGYEHRRGQLEMAEMVHDAFEGHHHAILEAGTGTGKTLAYLVPAICSGRRVVISTATKSLQEQLYQKDIPFLQKHFAPNLKVAVMKGRSNFL